MRRAGWTSRSPRQRSIYGTGSSGARRQCPQVLSVPRDATPATTYLWAAKTTHLNACTRAPEMATTSASFLGHPFIHASEVKLHNTLVHAVCNSSCSPLAVPRNGSKAAQRYQHCACVSAWPLLNLTCLLGPSAYENANGTARRRNEIIIARVCRLGLFLP
mmetsp:Transcript_1379/g.3548  ORF Transcript_1379/g.3548 Transcript_1379/m.3548 type:complete len:161 (+) Transcript_1379:2674-3156(+)